MRTGGFTVASFETRVSPEPNTGCWLWTGAILGNYGRFIYAHETGMLAHRAAWEFYIGPIPEDMCVCHRCDVPLCVNPLHLFLGTQRDNVADMDRKGRRADLRLMPLRIARGKRLPQTKLSPDQVRAIRANTKVQDEIASEYGISQSGVSAIKLFKRQAHIA